LAAFDSVSAGCRVTAGLKFVLPEKFAVLRVEEGKFGFVDSYGARMAGNRRLLCELTIHDGIVVYDLNGITRDSWDRLGNYQPQGDPSWDGTRSTGRKTR